MAYDVFISYRRETGVDDARLLQQALKARGYEVFFDFFNPMRDGNFMEKTFKAINEAPVFILMLTEGALNRCDRKEDWVRAEIECAIDNGRQIIPVKPSDQKLSFPDNLPIKLKEIPCLQVAELSKDSLFEESVDWIVQNCFPDYLARRRSSPYNKPPHDIFISYSRKNKDAVLSIKDEIEQFGLTCWIDLSDIPCGADSFKKRVIPGIRQTRVAFLFFLSAESQSSEYAMKEINFAKKRAKKRVVLVRFNDDEMTDEFYFDFQDADIIDWRQPEQKAKLLRDLRAWADEANEPHSPTATQKPSAESVKKQPEGAFVVCPLCGKKNRMEDTFRCRKCGQDNLCLHHRDDETYLCCECKGSACGSGGTHKKVQLWKDGPYWAETNIGAENPWDPGYYFWWGDTIGYKRKNKLWFLRSWYAGDGSTSDFSFLDVPTVGKSMPELLREGWITKDGILSPGHDAAHVQWGDGWRMPTIQEINELHSKCDWTLTIMNGVNGYVVCGRGDYANRSIFLPAAGYGNRTSLDLAGLNGSYWSSVPRSDYNSSAWGLLFLSGYHGTEGDYRYHGQSVRPVQGFAK